MDLTHFIYTIVTDNPTKFYALAIIIIAYSAAFLLYLFDPKNRNILILRSLPILVSIIVIAVNSYNQVCEITTSYNTFKLFMLCNVVLLAGGVVGHFQIKYMLVSHIISSIFHICFYFASYHNETASILATLYTPTLSYLGLLGFVYFVLSHFVLKEIRFDLIGNRIPTIDYFLPTNESKSHTMIILLQSYMMIIHMNFIIYFLDKWFDGSLLSFSVVLFIIIFQFVLIAISLRIMSKYPSSANVGFYVSANLMIIKILVNQIVLNYEIYRSNKSFCLQSQYFSNKLIYFSLCLFVICVFNGSVAYASDECASPVVEGASAGRVLRTGGTFAGAAGGYEIVSMGREAWENSSEAGEQGQVLNSKIEECIAAKNTLNTIKYKLIKEYNLIREVDIYLKRVQEEVEVPNANVDDLRNYKNNIDSYTTKLKSNYETYEQFKSHLTDQVYRRLFGTNNCCCGNRTAKES
jgi:hypothetical protein